MVETTKAYRDRHLGFRVALLYIDVDNFEGTLGALEHLYPAVTPGGIVALDEYAHRGRAEADAVDQFLKDKNVTLTAIPWANTPTAYFKAVADQILNPSKRIDFRERNLHRCRRRGCRHQGRGYARSNGPIWSIHSRDKVQPDLVCGRAWRAPAVPACLRTAADDLVVLVDGEIFDDDGPIIMPGNKVAELYRADRLEELANLNGSFSTIIVDPRKSDHPRERPPAPVRCLFEQWAHPFVASRLDALR